MVTKLEGLSISAILLLIVTFLPVGDTTLEPNYACAVKEIKAYCYDISSSGITCYTQPNRAGGKQCRGGLWEKIPVKPPETPVKTSSSENDLNRIHCSSKGCI